jgi:hypothetical protein
MLLPGSGIFYPVCCRELAVAGERRSTLLRIFSIPATPFPPAAGYRRGSELANSIVHI